MDGVEAEASLELNLDGRSTQVNAHMIYGSDRPTVDISVEFDRVLPSDLAKRLPEVAMISPIDVPISGQFQILARHTGVLDSVAFDLRSGRGALAGNLIRDQSGEIDLSARLTGATFDNVAAFAPALVRDINLTSTFDGGVTGRLNGDGRVKFLDLSFDGGPGRLTLRNRLPKPIDIGGLRFKARIEDDFNSVRLTEGQVDIDGSVVTANASARKLGDQVRLRLDAAVRNLDMAKLPRYWPKGLGKSARDWVTMNIRAGRVSRGTIAMVLHAPAKKPTRMTAESISGGLEYRDLVVRYFAGLPNAVEVAGTASFTKDRFDLDVAAGRVDDVQLENGVIHMTALDTDNERIAIDLVLQGSLATALRVADSPPLGYVRKLGIEPREIGGAMAMRLGFRFPLRTDVTLAEVQAYAAANMRGVQMPSGPFGVELSEGDLELKLASGTMQVGGKVLLNGVPLTIDWQEEFNPGTPFRSRHILSGRLDLPALRRLGLPDNPYVGGSFDGNLILTRFDDGRSEVLAGIDLESAVLVVPEIAWMKPVGVKGSLNMEMAVDKAGVATVERLTLEAGKLKGVARIAFLDRAAGFWRADIETLTFGGNDLRGSLLRSKSGAYEVNLQGRRLDIEPVLFDGELEPRETPSIVEGSGPPVIVNARIEELLIGPERLITDVDIRLRRQGSRLDSLLLEGRVDGEGALRVSYAPDGQAAGHRLEIHADDAGRMLKALDLSDRMEGGTLTISGRRVDPDAPLRGTVKVSKYKLTKAPALARLLQVASLTGILYALGQSGLEFVSLDGTYAYQDGRLEIERARTFGSSLGITVEGMMDIEADVAKLRGTIVPAYTVNQVLGKIPILGPLLVGGKDEGVFAANYAVTGSLEDPVIAVNPLSALAPGFLRKLFNILSGEESKKKPANAG